MAALLMAALAGVQPLQLRGAARLMGRTEAAAMVGPMLMGRLRVRMADGAR